MNELTDQQLLRNYTTHRSDPAFAELVRRHLDLVHSAAQRMVGDVHLARDVTQATFVALAQQAAQLSNRPALSGWLHTTARNLAVKTIRTDARRRVREQEAVAMNDLLSPTPDAPWEQIAPHLDAALGELNDADRDAVLLRYFEKKSAAEIGSTLGISSEAAQKRVSRAVERLREFFAKRGVTVGAGGLVVVISANAVQAAPAGLATTISAAALAGTAVTTSTLIAVTTKTIAMTTLQKTLVAATVAVLAGAGIYEARQATQLRDQVQTLQQQQAPMFEQIQQLQKELDEASNRVAGLNNDLAKNRGNNTELLKLRGEVGVLRNQLNQQDRLRGGTSHPEAKAAQTNQVTSSVFDDHPRETWKLAGYATPDAALQSWLWAYCNGDKTAMLNSLSPDKFKVEEARLAQKTETQLKEESERESQIVRGYQIVDQSALSDSEIELSLVIKLTDGSIQRPIKYRVVKVGDDWKFAGRAKTQ